MRVNGGPWQHVNMPSYTDRQYSYASATYTVNDGLEIWTEFIVILTSGDHMTLISQITKAMTCSSSLPSEVGSLMRIQVGISTMSESRWVTSVNRNMDQPRLLDRW